jgi:hypothetical protein
MRREGDAARKRAGRKPFRRQRVVARAQAAAGALGDVKDEHRPDARVVETGVHAEQRAESHLEPGLLPHLADRAMLRRLAVLHEAGRQAPRAGRRMPRGPASRTPAAGAGLR